MALPKYGKYIEKLKSQCSRQMHTSTPFSLLGEVTVKLLDQELQEVSDWFGLGLYLDIPPDELHTIKYEPTLRRIQDFRTEMFSAWMKKLPEPSWSRVVKALMEIGREKLARKIALKYGKNSC